MGYTRHHAIIVTSYQPERAEKARNKALELFGTNVTNSVIATVNYTITFCVTPDGSKEGWATSDTGDRARKMFISWLKEQKFDDGSSPYKWVEVQYGDDEGKTKVINHSEKK